MLILMSSGRAIVGSYICVYGLMMMTGDNDRQVDDDDDGQR